MTIRRKRPTTSKVATSSKPTDHNSDVVNEDRIASEQSSDSDSIPEEISPDASGGVSRQIFAATGSVIEKATGGGVANLGDGIESVGERLSHLGEKAERVPSLGAGVKQLGEGLAEIGGSLSQIPKMTKAPGGKALILSMLVGFALVFGWITAIVWFQLRDGRQPDFRPLAEQVLNDITHGKAATVYQQCSARMQETIRSERFVSDMEYMTETLSKFVEVSAVNETFLNVSAQGRIGRVSMTLEFEKAKTVGSVSFQQIDGTWRLLGLGIEVPSSIPITAELKSKRANMPSDVATNAQAILDELSRGGGSVWNNAHATLRNSVRKDEFVALQSSRSAILGGYEKVHSVRERDSLWISGLSATYYAKVQYEKGVAYVTMSFRKGAAGHTVAIVGTQGGIAGAPPRCSESQPRPTRAVGRRMR